VAATRRHLAQKHAVSGIAKLERGHLVKPTVKPFVLIQKGEIQSLFEEMRGGCTFAV
jgi:hypothetical protein